MKKIILGALAAALMLAAPTDLQAQGFLKKLKQKAEKAVNKVAGVEEKESAEGSEEQQESKGTPTATDRIPKLRQTGFIWDGQVTPSKASTVQGLMNELPALPSVEQIANPDPAEREAYYNRLSAISMRVHELDGQWTCSDEEMLAAREQVYKDLAEVLGLTVEEMKRMDDPNVSEAEKLRLEEKMRKHLLGDMDAEDLERKIEKNEARLAEIEKESKPYEKKAKAGTLTEPEKKRMEELRQEMMTIMQDMMSGMDGMMNVASKAQELNDKYSMDKELKAYSDKAEALRKGEEGIVENCLQIADDYEEELKDIYGQIYREEDADKIHALYDRADGLMKNYRTRAAKIWLRSLSVRLENTKKLLPEAEKVYAALAEKGLIPACAARRPLLNVVTCCEDILNEAYADFPQPSVLPYHAEAMNILKENERVMYAESGFGGGFGGSGSSDLFGAFGSGSKILLYNDKEEAYYKLENGSRTRLSGEGPFDFFDAGAKVNNEYGEIPLRKGNRVASFNTGRVLILHDGTYVCPVAMRKYADRIEFIIHSSFNQKEDFYKCTYKL